MKEESIGNFLRTSSGNAGFSTIEVLIAFSIVIVALAGATSISFGAQSLLLDGQLYLGAISRAEEVLGKNQSVSATSTIDNFYNENINILDITQCVKKVTVTESWKQEGVLKNLSFSQIFTDSKHFLNILDPCGGDELVAEDWQDYTKNNFPVEMDSATDIDVVDDFVYVSSNSGTTTDPDLFIFDLKNSYEKIAELDIGAGIFAMDATRGYVYAVTDATSSQFVVIDVREQSSPVVIARQSLFGVDPFGSYPEGRSIKYFDGKIYVGTKETAGPEFHIFDVSNPHNPYQIGFIEMTHNINDIEVRDGLAYLATSADTKELIIMDVHNPALMFEAGSFNAGTSAVNDRDGTALYLLGNTIYLGRKRGAVLNPEFYMIDISVPDAPKKLGDFNLALSGITSYVSAIITSSNLVFISTTDSTKSFFVLDISDPAHIGKISTANFMDSLSAIDMQDGIIYGTSLSGENIYDIQKN